MPVRSQFSTEPGGIAFLAAAPGDEEVIKGWPLVGSAGFLFAQALRAAGLTASGDLPADMWQGQRTETRRLLWERRRHSFLYVFNEPLPHGEVKHWCALAPTVRAEYWREYFGYDWPAIRGAGYLRPEHTHHLERVKQDILKCQPRLIVPLGGVALWALTGSALIDEYRGAVAVTSRLVPGIKILPMYEPERVMQQYKLLVPLIGDLMKAAREATFPEIRLTKKEIWLDPTLEDLRLFRALYCDGSRGPLSVDIETGGRQISCVGLSPDAHHSIIVPFVDYRKPNRSYWPTAADEQRAWEFVAEILANPAIEKLFQNGGAFDVFWFLHWAGIEVRNYRHDLRLVHKTLYPELPASLKFMGATYLNSVAWKAGVHHQEDKRDA